MGGWCVFVLFVVGSWWLDMISCCLMMKFKADDNEAEAQVGE